MRRTGFRGIGGGAVFALLLTLGAAVWPAQSALAATITVTTTADVTNGADGLTSLREAVVEANAVAGADTIVLVAATYDLTDCAAGELLHDGTGGDLVIQGNTATIHQTCDATRIMRHATNGTVLTITDANLIGGPNAGAVVIQGAAIAAANKLVLTNVAITGVDAGPNGSVLEFDFGPGDFDLELHGVSITGNTGSAVVNVSNPSGILVENSTLSGNTGAGISIGDGSPVTITGSTIADNGGYGVFTTGQGFGLQPIVTIAGTTISGNDRGGFTCRNGCRSLTVTDAQVLDNGASAALGQGGGLEFVTFQPASATPTVTVTNTTISGNSSQHDGGGLLVEAGLADGPSDPAQITITGSSITDNQVLCAGCDGGGIAALVGSLSVTNSPVTDNTTAGDGGGIFHTRDVADTASVDAVFALDQGTVSGNTAGGNGGGVSTGGRTQTVTASRVTGNAAGGIGGGIESYGVLPLSGSSSLAIERSTIDTNMATDGAGVSLAAGAITDISNSTITDNTATGIGGGLAVNLLAGLDLVHVTLTANAAVTGANLATSSPTTVDRSVLAQPTGGGANCSPYVGVPLPITSVGRSWFDDAGCNPAGTDTVTPAGDPQLGPLGDNGGATPTRLPAATSPLINLVPLADCATTVDQRGQVRPQGPGCEAGAVETADLGALPINGTNGNDVIFGTDGDDIINALAGHDLVFGLGGNDVINGGDGKDKLFGGPGEDTLNGGPGFDILFGSPGADIFNGGPGADLCFLPGQPQPVDC